MPLVRSEGHIFSYASRAGIYILRWIMDKMRYLSAARCQKSYIMISLPQKHLPHKIEVI